MNTKVGGRIIVPPVQSDEAMIKRYRQQIIQTTRKLLGNSATHCGEILDANMQIGVWQESGIAMNSYGGAAWARVEAQGGNFSVLLNPLSTLTSPILQITIKNSGEEIVGIFVIEMEDEQYTVTDHWLEIRDICSFPVFGRYHFLFTVLNSLILP